MKKLLATFLLFNLLTTPIFALTNSEAIPCIVGEASGQSYQEQVAISEALRNRNSLKGVYGCTAKHNKTEPAWVWTRCKKAWLESSKTNLVNGADHWESTNFKVPSWAQKMTVTAQVGSTRFYKNQKKGE
jgi:hypothetical protein